MMTHSLGNAEKDRLLFTDDEDYGAAHDMIPFSDEDDSTKAEESFFVYKRRWFILLIFSMNAIMNSMLFAGFSSVNNIVAKYYSVTPVTIEWLTNMFFICYIILCVPSMICISRFGIARVLITASLVNVLATCIQFPGYRREHFSLVFIGQLLSAVTFSAIVQIPGKLSLLWFAEDERATATAVGVFMSSAGVAVAFLQASLTIEDGTTAEVEKELKIFYGFRLALSAAIFLLTLLFKEKPPTAPSKAVKRDNLTFFDGLRLLSGNKYFIILSQCYGIYFGLASTILVLINPLVTAQYYNHQSDVGWISFSSNVIAILSSVIVGKLLDKYHKYQFTAIFLNVSSLVCWLTFVLLLTFGVNFYAIFVVLVILGLFSMPYFAGGIEQAAEITFPIPEETSSSIILLAGNTYSFIFITVFGIIAQHGYTLSVGYFMAGLYLISSILACFIKTDLNRLNCNNTVSSRMAEMD